MKKPPRSLRLFATVAAGLLALVACQNATDPNTNSDSPVVATASFPIAVPRVPDNAIALFQKDTVPNKLNCLPLGSDTSTTCTATLNLPHPLGTDSVALQLWTLGVQTYTLYFKESGSSTKLDYGSHSVASLDTLLLSGFAKLTDAQKSTFGTGPTGLVAYYASLLLSKDSAVVGKALPVGMSIDSVKKELVRAGVDSGKTVAQLTSLSIQLGSITLTLDTTTIRLDVSILIHAGVLSSSDSASLYPAYPVRVTTPIAVAGNLTAGGSAVNVTGSFAWTTGHNTKPLIRVRTSTPGDSANISMPTERFLPTDTTWSLSGNLTLLASAAAVAEIDTLVITLSDTSGHSATSRATFQVVPNASAPIFSPNGGSFYGTQNVAITAGGSDSIQISTDSTTWTRYASSVAVSESERLYARSFKGGSASAVTSAIFFIGSVPTPSITPNGGSFYGVDTVTIAAMGVDSIQVSTDSANWTKYATKIVLSSTEKIYTRGFKGGVASAVTSASFTSSAVPVPTIAPNGGTFYSTQSVAVTAPAGTDSIQISTDSVSWTKYTQKVPVSSSGKLYARSFTGGVASPVVSASFIIGSVPVPIISPNGGVFYSSQSVNVTAAGSDSIQISTDSTTWTLYTIPVSVTASEKLYTRAFKGGVASSVASATFSIGSVSVPSISPNGGTFYSAQSVTVSASGSDSIEISTDSTTWGKYTSAVSVSASEKLYARSFKGGVASSVASATFSIGSVSVPSISPNGGTFYSAQSVTVTATGSDSIEISTDSMTWSKYTSSLSVTVSEKLFARSFKGGVASSVASASFSIGSVPVPSIAPNGGSFYGTTTVTVSATGTDSIQISTDSTTWAKYSAALVVSTSEKLYARGFKGGVASAVTSASFTSSAIPVPTISPNGGTFYSAQTVTVTGPTGTDSVQTSKDSTTWTKYTQPISITASGKLYARSFAGGTASPVVSASFVIGTVPVPTISPNGGTIYTAQNVTVTAAGADSIQTSTDSATWTKYSSAVSVSSSGKLYARAFKGGVASTVVSATFTLATVPVPSLSPNGATYYGADTVIVSATGADSIETSLDNSTWSTYTKPVILTASGKLYARAFKGGGVSTVVSATFTLATIPVPTISPKGGSFTASQTVSISIPATAGATLQDSVSTGSAWVPYTSQLPVGVNIKIFARTVLNGMKSAPAEADFAFPPSLTDNLANDTLPANGVSTSTVTVTAPGSDNIYVSTDNLNFAPLKSGATYPMTTSGILTAYTVTGSATSAKDSITVNLYQRPPTISVSSGIFPIAQTVTISSPTTGAKIYYSTNGINPTTSSSLYSGPITVGTSKTVKAIAAESGIVNSIVTSASYAIADTNTYGIPWQTGIVYGAVQDSRDGQIYRTVTIGSQTWMAQNLNYSVTGSTCSGGATALDTCEKYGRNYSWSMAMSQPLGFDTTSLVEYSIYDTGICPSGWHLPSETEWTTFLGIVDPNPNVGAPGTMLHSMAGWGNAHGTVGNGTDLFGFRVLPLTSNGLVASYWTPGQIDAFNSTFESMSVVNDFQATSSSKGSQYPVRCLEGPP